MQEVRTTAGPSVASSDGMPEHPLEPIDLREPARDSRRLWWLLAVLLLAVPPVIWAVYYEPLAAGGAVACPPGSELTAAETGTEEVCLLAHEPGETITHTVTVANTGRLGINLSQVGFTDGGLLTITGAHLERQALPASVPAGSQKDVTFSARMLPCTDQRPDRLYTYTEVPVTQALGPIRKEIRVPLDPPLALDVRDCG